MVLHLLLGCLTVCVTRAGAGGGTPSDWKKCWGVEKGLESRQNPQRRVHALLGGFAQDTLIESQNYCHKTDKIIARTLLFSKNQKFWLAKTLAKNIELIFAKLLAEKRQTLLCPKQLPKRENILCWPKRLLKKCGFYFCQNLCEEKTSRFLKPCKTNHEQNRSHETKPIKTTVNQNAN